MSKADKSKQLLNELVTALEAEAEIERRLAEQQSFVLGGDGSFLGRITSPEHPESILNEEGAFGDPYGEYSVFNPVGAYGAEEGEYSARNPSAKAPPLLFVGGKFWGVLSPNGWPGGQSVSVERLLVMLKRDWRALDRGGLSDSGSVPTWAAS